MTAIVFLLEQWATGLYILLAAAFAYTIWRLQRVQREYRETQFELERDLARYKRANTLTAMVLILEAALVVLGIQQVVAPALRDTIDTTQTLAQVREDGDFATPITTPLAGGFQIDTSGVVLGEVDPADQILPTPTLTPTPVGTIVPNSPAPVGCETPNAQLQIPANGMIVFQPITVVGTANTENFAFYKFELNGPATFGNFAPLPVDGTQAVAELGDLGQFVPSFYEPGTYQFRLIVFDTTNAARASCTVTIYISEPIPTPTPLGATGAQ
jgi:hypothetical protein